MGGSCEGCMNNYFKQLEEKIPMWHYSYTTTNIDTEAVPSDCGGCKYFSRKSEGTGRCHAMPPEVINDAGGKIRHVRPKVNEGDLSCDFFDTAVLKYQVCNNPGQPKK